MLQWLFHCSASPSTFSSFFLHRYFSGCFFFLPQSFFSRTDESQSAVEKSSYIRFPFHEFSTLSGLPYIISVVFITYICCSSSFSLFLRIGANLEQVFSPLRLTSEMWQNGIKKTASLSLKHVVSTRINAHLVHLVLCTHLWTSLDFIKEESFWQIFPITGP